MNAPLLAADHTRIPVELRSGKILIAGAGVSGRGLAQLLHQLTVAVTVADDNPIAREQLTAAGIAAQNTAEVVIEDYTLVVTSPGWRPDTPLLTAAVAAGVPVIGDVEVVWRLDQAAVFGPPRTWLVVTGTNGKTTTTAMLAAMLSAEGLSAAAVGNIGVPITDALAVSPRIDYFAAELSSFQLHWADSLRPRAGVLLNLAEDHIDWHGSFSAYRADKLKALRGEVAVAGIDDEKVCEALHDAGLSTVLGFSLRDPKPGQFGVSSGRLVDNTGDRPLVLADATALDPPGPAGVLDALAAAALARSVGVSSAAIATALADFHAAGHRGQVVLERQGVRWVDNSKATNPHAAAAAMAGLDSVVWLAGGQLKGAEVNELVAANAPRLRAAVLWGTDRAELADALARYAPDVPVVELADTDPNITMQQAVAAADQVAHPGDTVLLAPAAASYDMFTGMAQRGDLFTAAARALPQPTSSPTRE